MKFWSFFQIQGTTSWDDARKSVTQAITNLSQIVTNKVNFADNIDCTLVEMTLASGQNSVNHTLGKVPYGYLILSKSATADIYNGTAEWTKLTISLTSSAPCAVKIAVIGG